MYQIKKFDNKLIVKINTSYKAIEEICKEVEKFANSKKFTEKKFALMLCIREGLVNAIKHGNKNDPEKMVYFEIKFDGISMNVIIQDEGQGFDWQKQKKKDKQKLKKSGWGRKIIKIYANEIKYNTQGNKIQFSIKT